MSFNVQNIFISSVLIFFILLTGIPDQTYFAKNLRYNRSTTDSPLKSANEELLSSEKKLYYFPSDSYSGVVKVMCYNIEESGLIHAVMVVPTILLPHRTEQVELRGNYKIEFVIQEMTP